MNINYKVTLSMLDISRIIQLSQEVGRSDKFVEGLVIITPKSATQDEIGLSVSVISLISASDSNPIPHVSVV